MLILQTENPESVGPRECSGIGEAWVSTEALAYGGTSNAVAVLTALPLNHCGDFAHHTRVGKNSKFFDTVSNPTY
ncbi:MAG: hypothetical protein J0M17_09890 [Planctomycetes bacterium]|nr:hypothetical protein [Planctomycetota bacterium]